MDLRSLRAASTRSKSDSTGGYRPCQSWERLVIRQTTSPKTHVLLNITKQSLICAHSQVLPKHLANFAQLLGEKTFFVGAEYTIADITCYDAVFHYGENLFPGSLNAVPKLNAWMRRIHELPNTRAYRASAQFVKLFPNQSVEDQFIMQAQFNQ